MKLQCIFTSNNKLDVETISKVDIPSLPSIFSDATINVSENQKITIQRINKDELLYTVKYIPESVDDFNLSLIHDLIYLKSNFKFCITLID
jgi:hypothetical protein